MTTNRPMTAEERARGIWEHSYMQSSPIDEKLVELIACVIRGAIKEAVAAEREACLKLVEDYCDCRIAYCGHNRIAAEIRARGRG